MLLIGRSSKHSGNDWLPAGFSISVSTAGHIPEWTRSFCLLPVPLQSIIHLTFSWKPVVNSEIADLSEALQPCAVLCSQRTQFPLSSGKGIPPAGICPSSDFLWQGIQEKVLPFTLTKLIPINSCHNTPLKVQLSVFVTKIKLQCNSKMNSLFLWSGLHSLARTPFPGTIHPLWQFFFFFFTYIPLFDLTRP